MEASSAAIPSFSLLPSETQPGHVQISMEQNLFDYLIEVEKGLGAASQFTDPSALVGKALETVDGVAQQAQEAFEKANTHSSGTSDEGLPQEGIGAADQNAREENMALSLDRAISVMWAAANVSMVTNGMTAATASANTLIKQQ